MALAALDPGFITGTGNKWTVPENDFIAYLVAWHYYLIDEWRLPLFSVPSMGYPEGGSVLFNDALPLTALPTKLLYKLFGLRVNPFGWWTFLTYPLQGAMAARLLCAVGVRSVWASVAAATLAVLNVTFITRMGHTALSSHFLILWALALHFDSLRRERVRAGEFAALLALAILVNSYLFAMALVLAISTLAALSLRRQVSARDLGLAALSVLAVCVLGLLAGYGVMFVDPNAMKGEGFGRYSWNLVALLLPPDGALGFRTGIPRDATAGQYEGEAYIGMGALLLLGLWLARAPRTTLDYARRYWVLSVTFLALAVYAASNRVYAGHTLVIEYGLPDFVLHLCNFLRASGRFIWPLSYSLAILPVACLFRWWRPAPAIAAAGLAVFLQVSEARPAIEQRRYATAAAYRDLIDAPRMTTWLAQHQRFWQYPLLGLRRAGRPDEALGEPRNKSRAAGPAGSRARGHPHEQRLHVTRPEEVLDRARVAIKPHTRGWRAVPAGSGGRASLASAHEPRAIEGVRHARMGRCLLAALVPDCAPRACESITR